MDAFQLREPISALSHGVGMILALVATRGMMSRLRSNRSRDLAQTPEANLVYRRGKTISLFIFGTCLTFCYGVSGVFHAVPIPPGSANVFHRLDHVGIYLLIAGSYTPVAWSMMRGVWRTGTLTVVWAFALICSTRVWLGGLLPIWLSTLIYMSMGWAALGCYHDLTRRHSQRILYPLPLGGLFYSVGAIINLLGRPVFVPGVFAAHELFHFLVLAGSACHFHFMLAVVIPAVEPEASPTLAMCRNIGIPSSFIPVPKFLNRNFKRLSQEQS